MSDIPTEVVYPSFIDKLVSDVDYLSGSRSTLFAQVKELVRRDLEKLLNTRCRCEVADITTERSMAYLLYYGIPDFTGATIVTTQERETLKNGIKGIIRKNEPRFSNVDITEFPKQEKGDRTIRFRIKADIKVKPSVKPIVFDSVIDPITRTVNIKDTSNG